MPKVKLNFSRLPIPEKIAKARQIVAALTGNPDFPDPTPAIPVLNNAIEGLETAFVASQAARQDAKTRTTEQNSAEDTLDRLFSQSASYVEAVAGDNESLIQSAAMDLRVAAVSTNEAPGAPAALSATGGDHDGEIDLTWDTTPGSRSYIIEKSLDPPTPTSWAHAGVSTRSRITINNLTSGSRYWFRVAAINSNGQSGWSDPATKIAP